MKNKLLKIILSLIFIVLCVLVLSYLSTVSKNENVFVRNVSEIEKLNPEMTDPNSIVSSVEKRLHILGYENIEIEISNNEYGKYSVKGFATKSVTIVNLKLPKDNLYYISKY